MNSLFVPRLKTVSRWKKNFKFSVSFFYISPAFFSWNLITDTRTNSAAFPSSFLLSIGLLAPSLARAAAAVFSLSMIVAAARSASAAASSAGTARGCSGREYLSQRARASLRTWASKSTEGCGHASGGKFGFDEGRRESALGSGGGGFAAAPAAPQPELAPQPPPLLRCCYVLCALLPCAGAAHMRGSVYTVAAGDATIAMMLQDSGGSAVGQGWCG